MSPLRQRLLEIYTAGTVQDVQQSQAYQVLCREYQGDRVFDAERNRMEGLRLRVDKYLGPRESHHEQVEFALRLLRKPETTENKHTCRTLILRTYATQWHAEQRQYFELKSPAVMNWRDYFLSFTNRNPMRPSLNEINHNHKFFIIDTIGRTDYDRYDLSEQNLVAKAVHYLLKNCSLDGFYYHEHEEDNDLVEKKLSDKCAASIAFVQLVQGALFRHNSHAKNWCFFEYEVARKQDPKRILFVQIEDPIAPHNFHPDFDDWFGAFQANDPIKLEETHAYKLAVINRNRDKVRTKLPEQIARLLNQIYIDIPH